VVNEELCKNNPECNVVTLFIGLLDAATGTLRYLTPAMCVPISCHTLARHSSLRAQRTCRWALIPISNSALVAAAGVGRRVGRRHR